MTRDTRDYIYIPTLQLGGALDGLTTVMRMAESFYFAVLKHPKPEPYPVVVIEGMSHMEFAEGNIPSHVKDEDLKPDITYE